jgi:hypothetical protein
MSAQDVGRNRADDAQLVVDLDPYPVLDRNARKHRFLPGGLVSLGYPREAKSERDREGKPFAPGDGRRRCEHR